jgi:hypothetical protein
MPNNIGIPTALTLDSRTPKRGPIGLGSVPSSPPFLGARSVSIFRATNWAAYPFFGTLAGAIILAVVGCMYVQDVQDVHDPQELKKLVQHWFQASTVGAVLANSSQFQPIPANVGLLCMFRVSRLLSPTFRH